MELIENYKYTEHYCDPCGRLRLGRPGASAITLCSMSSFETRLLNRPSRPGRAMPDPGLQFPGLRIPVSFCPTASNIRTTALQRLTVIV